MRKLSIHFGKALRHSGFHVVFPAILLLLFASCHSGFKHLNQNGTNSPLPDSANAQTFQELGFFGKIKENMWDSFLTAVRHNVSNSRNEPGNLSFHLYQPEEDTLEPIWFERFQTKAAHNAHKEQQYFKDAISVISQSLKETPVAITLKEITEIPAITPIPYGDTKEEVHVITQLKIRPENRNAFIEKMQELASISRQSPGNIEFNLYTNAEDSNQFVVIDAWENKRARTANINTEFVKRSQATIRSYLVSDTTNRQWITKEISN